MKIALNRNDSENEKESKGKPRSPLDPFQEEQRNPENKRDQEKDPSLGKIEEIEMAPIEPDRIGDQYGNKRQAKYLCHLRPSGISFLQRIVPSPK